MTPDLVSIAQKIAIWALPVLFAITLHEVAHVWVARALCDRTAEMLRPDAQNDGPFAQTGGARGMRTLDSDLLSLFFQGVVSEEEVFNYCQNPEAMRERMRGGSAAR